MKWEYKGRKLANPLLIIWRLFWFIPFKVSVLVATILAYLAWGRYAAEQIWEAGK